MLAPDLTTQVVSNRMRGLIARMRASLAVPAPSSTPQCTAGHTPLRRVVTAGGRPDAFGGDAAGGPGWGHPDDDPLQQQQQQQQQLPYIPSPAATTPSQLTAVPQVPPARPGAYLPPRPPPAAPRRQRLGTVLLEQGEAKLPADTGRRGRLGTILLEELPPELPQPASSSGGRGGVSGSHLAHSRRDAVVGALAVQAPPSPSSISATAHSNKSAGSSSRANGDGGRGDGGGSGGGSGDALEVGVRRRTRVLPPQKAEGGRSPRKYASFQDAFEEAKEEEGLVEDTLADLARLMQQELQLQQQKLGQQAGWLGQQPAAAGEAGVATGASQPQPPQQQQQQQQQQWQPAPQQLLQQAEAEQRLHQHVVKEQWEEWQQQQPTWEQRQRALLRQRSCTQVLDTPLVQQLQAHQLPKQHQPQQQQYQQQPQQLPTQLPQQRRQRQRQQTQRLSAQPPPLPLQQQQNHQQKQPLSSDEQLLQELGELLECKSIELPGGLSFGTHRAACPECEGGRQQEDCFAVTLMREGGCAVWCCHRATCGFTGSVRVRGWRRSRSSSASRSSCSSSARSGGRRGEQGQAPASVSPAAPGVSAALAKGNEADAAAGAAAAAAAAAALGVQAAGETAAAPAAAAALPRTDRLQPLSHELLGWFAKRGISAATLSRNQVAMEQRYSRMAGSHVQAIAFPFHSNGVVVNIKYRVLPKRFSQSKGGQQVLYGIDDIKGQEEVILVEGELDKLALNEAGLWNVASVPAGAIARARSSTGPNASASGNASTSADGRSAGASTDGTGTPTSVEGSSSDVGGGSGGSRRKAKLWFVQHAEPLLAGARRIVLATDADGPGDLLASEIAARLGPERCWRLTWPAAAAAAAVPAAAVSTASTGLVGTGPSGIGPLGAPTCKDANDYLMQFGPAALRRYVAAAAVPMVQ